MMRDAFCRWCGNDYLSHKTWCPVITKPSGEPYKPEPNPSQPVPEMDPAAESPVTADPEQRSPSAAPSRPGENPRQTSARTRTVKNVRRAGQVRL